MGAFIATVGGNISSGASKEPNKGILGQQMLALSARWTRNTQGVRCASVWAPPKIRPESTRRELIAGTSTSIIHFIREITVRCIEVIAHNLYVGVLMESGHDETQPVSQKLGPLFFIDLAKGKTYKKGIEELNYK